MAEDLKTNIQSYQIQLQQVEAALTTEPSSEELLKLKKDLLEVLNLSKELLIVNEPDVVPTSSVEETEEEDNVYIHKWRSGESCLAPWSEDGQYYEATIEEVTEDGQCTVNFHSYGNTEVALVNQLKPLDKDLGEDSDGGPKSKKQMVQAKREYKKKKAQKKVQRMKQIEEEREKEKSKWQQFNAKAFSKSKKGQVKKSIFASPDNINGRVGVGTCGIGGRPMTEYHQQEKWRRPMQPPPTRPLDGM